MTALEPRLETKATPKRNRRGEPWDAAYERIHREIPSSAGEITWPKTIPLAGLMRLIGDIGTVGITWGGLGSGRGGRGGHDRREHSTEVIADSIETVFRKGVGVGQGSYDHNDCTDLSFVEAFRQLRGDRTVMQLARRTMIDRRRLQRLLDGEYPPTGVEMEVIARTFSKQPWYFREYRSTMIAAWVLAQMDGDPDLSASVIRALAS